MGTPDFAVPTMVELASRGHEIVAVYTRAPAAAGRGMDERRSPVHETAARLGVPVLHPPSLKGEAAAETFRAHKADVAVVVAYGLLLPKAILDTPQHGCLNLHASLLPRWRGAAPINRAIMAGDAETGVMVMRMEEGLDTGPVALAERVPIAPDATAGELHDQLAVVGADLMARALAALVRGSLKFEPQPQAGATYAKKIEKGETRIDWSRPAAEVHNYIRGLSPFPGAWFELAADGKPVRVKVIRSIRGEGSGAPGTVLDDQLTIACGEGAVRLLQVQKAGAKAMSAEEFLRGTPLQAGTRLP
ncbi:MAG: methionyl-tRNA formyltransferase [Bradyrhizobiaceae bacterium]|nr:methionyl-tRNA formyltransferase [Bradyrhizobiaceae bacterium]